MLNVSIFALTGFVESETFTISYNPSSIEDNTLIPELPATTVFRSIYPNPFKSGIAANIEVNVKANEAATVSIYNLAGQRIHGYSLVSGNHLLSWDGKDSKGQNCNSGIFLLTLKSPSAKQTAKLMFIK
jgi:flagellar hook assembly protein FlgD